MPPEHEHTPNCKHDQAHTHTHDHAPDHPHSHDHNPAHEHGHNPATDDEHTESFHLSIDEHEDALVASVLLERSGNYRETDRLLHEQLKGLSDRIEGSGGVVGHIKASLILEECSQSYSITQGVVQTIKQESGPYRIGLVAIVFGVSKQDLTEFLKTLLA
jgi:hypothetical protein